jgi:hypothetical protein
MALTICTSTSSLAGAMYSNLHVEPGVTLAALIEVVPSKMHWPILGDLGLLISRIGAAAPRYTHWGPRSQGSMSEIACLQQLMQERKVEHRTSLTCAGDGKQKEDLGPTFHFTYYAD